MIHIMLMTSCQYYYFQLGPPGPPQYLQVFNTSYNYINIQWKPPFLLFDGLMSGFIVRVTKFGDTRTVARLIYSSCHAEEMNIKDLEENTMYCVYVTTFNKYGKGNSSSCIVAVTGERGMFC